MKMLGIDVSDNQGVIDWKKVKNAGVEFAILRTVRRSGKADKYLSRNYQGCLENAIPVHFYKYGYALNESEAQYEAEITLFALEQIGVKPSKNTVIWYDVEDDTQTALSTDKLSKICKSFKETVEDAGFSFGLYMGKYDFEKGEVDLSQFGETHVWLARYYDGYKQKNFGEMPNEAYKPHVTTGELCGWQFSSSGKVNGINGNVDLDIVYCDVFDHDQDPDNFENESQKMIEQAKKYLGKKESDGIHKEIIDIYNQHKPLARGYKVKYSDSWCAVFISALAIQCGLTDIIPTECSCQEMIELFKKIGCWIEDESYTPVPGDIVFYDWQDDGEGDNVGWSDHVGLAETVLNGKITVIEGNYENSVKRRYVSVNGKYIRGYGVPKYRNITSQEPDIDKIAREFIKDVHGDVEKRKKALEAKWCDYEAIMKRVHEILKEDSYYPKYEGKSNYVDEVLRSIGVPEKYIGNKTKRKPIADANNISKNYTGKQNENLAIVSLAKNGKLKKVK